MAKTQQIDLILDGGRKLTYFGAVQVNEEDIGELKITGIDVHKPVDQPAPKPPGPAKALK